MSDEKECHNKITQQLHTSVVTSLLSMQFDQAVTIYFYIITTNDNGPLEDSSCHIGSLHTE